MSIQGNNLNRLHNQITDPCGTCTNKGCSEAISLGNRDVTFMQCLSCGHECFVEFPKSDVDTNKLFKKLEEIEISFIEYLQENPRKPKTFAGCLQELHQFIARARYSKNEVMTNNKIKAWKKLTQHIYNHRRLQARFGFYDWGYFFEKWGYNVELNLIEISNRAEAMRQLYFELTTDHKIIADYIAQNIEIEILDLEEYF